ncbi:MAG: glycosyltransferase [Candidatus Promineifilaceae bacterium]
MQVNSTDTGGGAARCAVTLHQAYRQRGHRSWLAVGTRRGDDPFVLPIAHNQASPLWQRPFWRVEAWAAGRRTRAARWLRYLMLATVKPRRVADWYHGYEDFRFPNTANLLELPGEAVDILHLHNLHGRYFDLRQLPNLTARTPTVLSLHDAWLMSGHCAHSLDCERWRDGCGHCPDLTLYPSILRDATAENWRRKQAIYAASRFVAIAPSNWLAERAADSPLAAGLTDLRVIHHGVDRTVFSPGDRAAARNLLGLPQQVHILLTVANRVRSNPWKDFSTAHQALAIVAQQKPSAPLLVLCVGDQAAEQTLGRVTIRYVPPIEKREIMALYYQAADLYLNSSKIESFSLAILEALACGVPVVATAVGGTPEQITSWPEHDPYQANGMLVAPGDASAMAQAIEALLANQTLRQDLGRNAAKSVSDLSQQVDSYLNYYELYLRNWRR